MVRPLDAVMERTMFGRTIFGAVSLAALAFTTLPAHAQLVATDPNNSVLIDLGAIDGGGPAPRGSQGRVQTGVGAGVLGTMPSGGGQLLMPPQSAPSSRLMGPDGRSLREAALPSAREDRDEPRLTQPRAAAPKAAKAPAQSKAQPKAEVARAEPAARPSLPPVALPSMPAPAAPTPPKDGGPVALTSPTPPPTMAPAPVPDIPTMQVVGPDTATKAAPKAEQQASVAPQVTAPTSNLAPQPKAATAAPAPLQPQAKAPPASKGPTPAPTVAPAPPVDAPTVTASVAPPAATKAAPQAQPKAEQQAALPAPRPSTAAPKGGAAPQGMDILFASGVSDLSNDAKAALDKLAENLKGDEKSRLQLLAYASEDSPSKARRLSLSRALAVRSHLIAKGVRSTRIDVRALGDQIPSGEPNRVDLQITDR